MESCSPGLAAILGVPVVGVNQFADLSDQFDRQDFAALDAAAQALRRANTPFDLRVTTGSDRLLQARGRVVTGTGAEPISFLIWFHDISGVRAETVALMDQAARAVEQQALTQRVLDTVPFPAWRRRPDLSISWVNMAYCAAVEVDAATAVRDSVELLPGTEPNRGGTLADMAQKTGAVQSEKKRFAVGGERRTFEIIETPLDVGGTLGIARDVTGREDALGELDRHTEAHASVMDRLPSAIAIFGPDKRLSFFNEAFFRLWGLDEDWLEQNPSHGEILETLRESRRLPEQADFPAFKAQVLEQYTSVIEPLEEQQHLPDGRTLRVVTAPHTLGGLLFIYEDVSDRLEMERSRNTLAAVQLATLDHLFEGVAVFGSDGRLQLSNSGYAKIWNLDLGYLATEPHVADLAERCRTLFPISGGDDWPTVKARVIDRTLDRTARSARLERLSFETIDVKDMLSTAVKLSGRRAEQRELTLVLDCPDEIGTFDADGNRIKQVLFNLVNNSMTFTPQGRIVTVSAAREGDEIALTVADSGEGIAQGDQRAVFEKFRRSLDRRKSGAGLGLSLVKSFVELHGGHVELDSVRGAGTRVTCWLPISQPAAHRVAIEGP